MTTKLPAALAQIATQGEAEAGTISTKLMTPERVKQAITALAAPGGGLQILSTVTASDVASVDFDDFIDDTYDTYLFTGTGVRPSIDTATPWLLTSSNGGSSYDQASNQYGNAYRGRDSNGSNIDVSELNSSYGRIGPNMSNVATDALNFNIWMFDPSVSATKTQFATDVTMLDGGTQIATRGTMFRNSAAIVDAIQFRVNTGNITGEFKMFGIKKS